MPLATAYKPSSSDLPRTSPLRVLVVDDNRNTVESLTMLLDLHGNTTHTAYDGLEAVRIAEAVRPEIVLLDIGLPKIDGYEACRRIREQEWGRAMIVVALTGLGHDDDRLKSRQAGFDMHLVKPVDPEILLAVLAATPREPQSC
jgi:DNA-binding response OmpR family regulator